MDKLYDALYNATSSVLGGTGPGNNPMNKCQELATKRHSLLHGSEWFHLWGPDEKRESAFEMEGSFLTIFGRVNLGKVLWLEA